MTDPDIGVVVSTLVADPLTCTGAELLAAVAAAEEVGIGQYMMWPHHISSTDLPDSAERIAAWTGRVRVLEGATGFTRGATPRFIEEVQGLVDLAVRLGVPMIATCTLRAQIEDLSAAAEGLAAFGEAAARAGVDLCLEFLPWTAIPTLAAAWALVQQTGLDGVGLVLDTWHFQRQPGGPDNDVLESIPGDRIRYVQISDAGAVPDTDLMTEALTRRLLPGDGVIDFDRLHSSLAAIGADPVYATEVYNTTLALTGAHDMALALQQAARGMPLGRSGAIARGDA
ncbi:MAG: hypothetical protein QOJ34_3352 [Pseudonocardiales bacterium]|nr:hypothetical protein [Pseudonocardiales bacterium]